jgi:non-specific serine/threonine protein kinase
LTTIAASFRYRFGLFELQPDERRLLNSGRPVHLGPHAFDVLIVLVEQAGRLVRKDELLERVWPRVVVEENTLQAHISALRKILGPDSIATISGRGYRFTPEVNKVAQHAASSPKHNLPHHCSFIGRETEVAALIQLLGRTRLLTLIGAGGCGKTRLATTVAAEMWQLHSDGAWFVELAALTDPGLIPQTVANVLAIKEQPGKGLAETLADQLASRHMLLVLDNAEHLLEGCARLAEALLRQCATLAILVTSRERLGILGELTYRVPSLSVPDERDATLEQISRYESVRLFIDRARLQRPDFAISTRDAAALVSICRRLDGVALAIELAAPRVRSMTIEELSRHRSALACSSRFAHALPRSERCALIDWSYDL